MTKLDFLSSLPDIIEHKSRGYGELEIVQDDPTTKGACYRHLDNTTSGSNFAADWVQLQKKLSKYLKEAGYTQ